MCMSCNKEFAITTITFLGYTSIMWLWFYCCLSLVRACPPTRNLQKNWSIQNPNFLHSIVPKSQLQDSDSIYLLLQRKYTPEVRKSMIDITYSWFTKNPKIFPVNLVLTAVSHYTPINTSVIYTRTHYCDTNDTSRNVTGCSSLNAHAQFP